ncbi:MAG: S9 family peptidase [Bryobacterales bacterium]|nr:S9 family peptidase [Bryobacterales bacterium]
MSQKSGLARSGLRHVSQVESMTADNHENLEQGETRRTKAWLGAQSERLRAVLHWSNDRNIIERLAKAVLAAPAMDIPFSSPVRSVFSYRAADERLPQCCSRDGLSGPLTIVASPIEKRGQHTTPHPLAISTDGQRAVIGWRTGGRDELDVQIVDLDSGEVLAQALPAFETHRTVWNSSLRGYWYVDQDCERVRLLYQSIDDSCMSPVVVQCDLPTSDPRNVCLIRFAESRWLILAIRSPEHLCAFNYYVFHRDTRGPLRPLWQDWTHRTSYCAVGDQLFVLTSEQAPNMRVLRLKLSASTECTSDVLIPEGPNPITSMHLAGMVLLLRTAITPWTSQLSAFSLEGKELDLKGLPTDGTIEAIQVESGGAHAYVEESGIGRRPTIHSLDTRTGQAKVHFQPYSRLKLPVVETITTWYESQDGTRVPIRITRGKDLPSGVPLPTMLTAYGGFGVVDTMRYTNRSALWLSLGGVYVHAGVRGGGELGADWHRAGRLQQKPNTFADFIAAAEWLVEQGYTTPDKLAIAGGSNAGLVVAVAMTMRPELFGAVICSGPLLDMLRYHLFAGGEIGLPEFGSPENPEEAAVLRSYSPYHNICEGVDYPPVLFVSGDSDTRCDPMHVRKMVARMQDANPGGRPVLLDYRPNKGHSGLMPLADRIDSLTNQFDFLVGSLGLRIDENGKFDSYRRETVTPS